VAVQRRARHVTLRDGREAVVRSAVPGDAGRLRRLVDAVAAEPEAPLLREPGTLSERDLRRRIAHGAGEAGDLLLVAIVEKELAGSVHLEQERRRASAHVYGLGITVARAYRGLGLGSALLEVATEWAQRRGGGKIALSVFPHNAAALRFYEARGFVREGLRRGQFVRAGKRLDEVLMGRLLDEEAFVWTSPTPGGH
jgi:RimJ/RimL family protein N-acetyltransferase